MLLALQVRLKLSNESIQNVDLFEENHIASNYWLTKLSMAIKVHSLRSRRHPICGFFSK